MRSNYSPIGNYVRQVKAKNTDGSVSLLRGVSIEKFYMPSVANINGVDLKKYKVVAPGQFAFNPMHVGRDRVLPISLLKNRQSVIVSPAYTVFEITNNELLPDYLMMWFRRPEFDRNAWFKTDGNVRGGLSWDDFCEIELPVPSPAEQIRIVKEYETVADRILLNKQLNIKLEESALTIYKQWFVEFEFPMPLKYAESLGKPELTGQPYKTSGGEMRFDKSLGKDIPANWEVKNLDKISEIKAGGDKPKNFSAAKTNKFKFPIYANGLLDDGLCGFAEDAIINKKSITISARGTIGYCALRYEPFIPIVRLLVVTPTDPLLTGYLHQWARSYDFADSGSVQSQLTIPQISNIAVLVPTTDLLSNYELVTSATTEAIKNIKHENGVLQDFSLVVFARMSLPDLQTTGALV